MEPEALTSTLAAVREAETNFFASMSPEIRTRLASIGLVLKNLPLYGEIFFLLAGLKPAVLFDNIVPELQDSYRSSVLQPLLLKSGPGASAEQSHFGERES